jgi:hypothetical protein
MEGSWWLHHRLPSRAPSGANNAFTISQQRRALNCALTPWRYLVSLVSVGM